MNTRKGKKYGHKNVSTLLSHLTMDTFLLLLFIVIVIKHRKRVHHVPSARISSTVTLVFPTPKTLPTKLFVSFVSTCSFFGSIFLKIFFIVHVCLFATGNHFRFLIGYLFSSIFSLFSIEICTDNSHTYSLIRVSLYDEIFFFSSRLIPLPKLFLHLHSRILLFCIIYTHIMLFNRLGRD